MDESKMTILTQEEFNNAANHSGSRFVRFEDRIVDIKNVYNFKCFVFTCCKIIGIEDETAEFIFPSVFEFHSCEIVDCEKISDMACKHAYFENCSFIKPAPLACPAEGEFIGWKKCFWTKVNEFGHRMFPNQYRDTCLVKLLIPADAKRSSAFTNKCRCDKAKVLEVYNSITDNELTGNFIAYSSWVDKRYYKPLYYEKGKWVYPDSFDENRFNECSHGIHFFMDKEEARIYSL